MHDFIQDPLDTAQNKISILASRGELRGNLHRKHFKRRLIRFLVGVG